jgi:hypothetical protein
MLKYIILLLAVFSVYGAGAQGIDKVKNESWVRIMHNDSTVNFFKAQKDFAKFRAEHNKEAAKEDADRKKEVANGERRPNEPHLEDPEEAIMMAYQKWARSMKPFVTKDGKIMPLEQRMAVTQKGR